MQPVFPLMCHPLLDNGNACFSLLFRGVTYKTQKSYKSFFLLRGVLHPICGLSVCVWYPAVPAGDQHGPVHRPGQHHLLEEDLPSV